MSWRRNAVPDSYQLAGSQDLGRLDSVAHVCGTGDRLGDEGPSPPVPVPPVQPHRS